MFSVFDFLLCVCVSVIFGYCCCYFWHSLESRTLCSLLVFFPHSVSHSFVCLQKLSTRCHANNTCHAFNACNLVWLTMLQHTHHITVSLSLYILFPDGKQDLWTSFSKIEFCLNVNRNGICKWYNEIQFFLLFASRSWELSGRAMADSTTTSSDRSSISIKIQCDDDQFMDEY